MKTTFKKVFNGFDDELMNINENNLSDIDIDVNKIKEDVLMRIKNDDSKKKSGKKLFILLAAAIILLTGTIGAFASEDIQRIFNGMFNTGSNVNALGLYDGGNVTVKTKDDSLDIKLLGVTGDGEKLYSAIEITKKDGSAVIDEKYKYPKWLFKIDDKSWTIHDYCRAECMEKNSDKPARVINSVRYKLSDDNKTLKLYVYSVINDEVDLMDGRMTIYSEGFTAHKIDKEIISFDLLPENNSISEEERMQIISLEDELLDKKCRELGITEDDTISIQLEDEGKVIYCQGSYETIDFPFEMSYDLNYQTDNIIEKDLNTDIAPNLIKPYAQNIKMQVTPFGVYLNAQCDLSRVDITDYHTQCFKGVDWDDTSKITLSDGTVYYLYSYEGGGDTSDEAKGIYYETYPLNYSIVPGPRFNEINVIDTREIESVMINGNVVYNK